MNQNLRFCVCRSLLRRNPFTRWSSNPIFYSSLISNNPTSSNLITVLISKCHHTFNYPPQIFSIPRNQFRKCNGEPATAECNFYDACLDKEINKLHSTVIVAHDIIKLDTLPPLDVAKIPAEKFNTLMEKLGFDIENGGCCLPHLQKFTSKIRSLKECVDATVAYGEHYVKNGGFFSDFEAWYYAYGPFEGLKSESDTLAESQAWYHPSEGLESESDTLPIARDQIAMPVDADASAIVAKNLAANTNQDSISDLCSLQSIRLVSEVEPNSLPTFPTDIEIFYHESAVMVRLVAKF